METVAKVNSLTRKVAFDNYSTEEVRRVQKLLNNRPRKKLNFLTPGQLFIKSSMKPIQLHLIVESTTVRKGTNQ